MTPQTPSARFLVLQALLTWRDPRIAPAVPERDDPSWSQLSLRDRTFAFDLLTGIIRWRSMLDVVLASRLKQPLDQLEPTVRAILWLGSFQLLLHTGSPAYASVHTSVELAKTSGAARAAGLINAVLRGITRLDPITEPRGPLAVDAVPRDFITQIKFNAPLFPGPQANLAEHLAVVTSHPVELVNMLLAAYDQEITTNILVSNNQRPIIVLRADAPDYNPPVAGGLIPHRSPGYFVAAQGWNRTISELIADGSLSPQDPASGKAVPLLAAAYKALPAATSTPRSLDLCAGLGTKTIQLARTFPEGSVVAVDVDAAKLTRLMDRATRLNLKNVVTHTTAEVNTGKVTPEPFDLALVDVPCSNTGVMGRRVQSRWRWPGVDRAALARTQGNLLDQAAKFLKPGGVLAYSTCSIDPVENRHVVDAAIARNPKLELQQDHTTLPAASTDPTERTDGGYVAILSLKS